MTIAFEEDTDTLSLDTPLTLNGTSPETTDAIVQVFVDCNAMTATDRLVVTIKEKTISGGTARAVFKAVVYGVQAEPIFASPALLLGNGWDIVLEQTDGTGRAFPWSIRKVT